MRTEFINIHVHEDNELETILNCKLISREKLSHWPLSYVEKLSLADGTYLIYKSQHSTSSVEKEIYETIKSPFLLTPCYYEIYENCDIMIFPFIEYPTLAKDISDHKLEQLVAEVSKILNNFGEIPIFFDFSTPEKLIEVVDSVCEIFEDETEVAVLKEWLHQNVNRLYDNQEIGYLHGDLKTTNLLAEGEQLKYILDWQRPFKGPLALEKALAFLSNDRDAKGDDFEKLAIICHFIWFSYAHDKYLNGLIDESRRLLQKFELTIK